MELTAVKRWTIHENIPGKAHFFTTPGPAVRHRVSLVHVLWLAGYASDGMGVVGSGAAYPASLVPHLCTCNGGDLSPVSLVGVLFRLTDRPTRALYGTYPPAYPISPPAPHRSP